MLLQTGGARNGAQARIDWTTFKQGRARTVAEPKSPDVPKPP
jgi:hypothetical protein